MADSLDVSGVWYGSWNATHPDVKPNRFIALLAEAGGSVSGTITEPDEIGLTEILSAFVHGRRTGSDIEWTKQYDGSGRLAHAVTYTGQVNGDATEISGDWQFESYGGSFTMERELFAIEELEDEEQIILGLED